MATTTNYTVNNTRRRVDMYVMGSLDFTSEDVQETNQTMAAEEGGRVCAGIVKVAQKVAITLLAGNILNDYDWGTSLASLMLSNQLQTIKTEMDSVLAAGVKYVQTSLVKEEDPKLPDDELIGEVVLQDWYLDTVNNKLVLSVSVSTRNFETMPIVVPISIVP